MKEKIEVGDTVRLNSGLTLNDVRTWLSDLYSLIGSRTKRITGVSETGMVEIEGSKRVWWNQKYFEIVKKAPKTLYFDARKMKEQMVEKNDVPLEEWKQGGYMECHGLKKEEALKRYSWVGEMFTTEKPAPLEIIDGVVK